MASQEFEKEIRNDKEEFVTVNGIQYPVKEPGWMKEVFSRMDRINIKMDKKIKKKRLLKKIPLMLAVLKSTLRLALPKLRAIFQFLNKNSRLRVTSPWQACLRQVMNWHQFKL